MQLTSPHPLRKPPAGTREGSTEKTHQGNDSPGHTHSYAAHACTCYTCIHTHIHARAHTLVHSHMCTHIHTHTPHPIQRDLGFPPAPSPLPCTGLSEPGASPSAVTVKKGFSHSHFTSQRPSQSSHNLAGSYVLGCRPCAHVDSLGFRSQPCNGVGGLTFSLTGS